MSIRFEECPIWGYPARTKANVIGSDVTIAIAKDFNSAGERLTKKLCIENDKEYIPVMAFRELSNSYIEDLLALIPSPDGDTTINIAGNGIYSLAQSQNECDEFTYALLHPIAEQYVIKLVRSGGQSGFDQSGIKAGNSLQLDCLIYAPKGWTFRGKNRVDVSNEKLFKDRFL